MMQPPHLWHPPSPLPPPAASSGGFLHRDRRSRVTLSCRHHHCPVTRLSSYHVYGQQPRFFLFFFPFFPLWGKVIMRRVGECCHLWVGPAYMIKIPAPSVHSGDISAVYHLSLSLSPFAPPRYLLFTIPR